MISIRSNISTIPGQRNKPVMDPLVSIIIHARNDAQALRLTLDYLERLRGIETAEIIVAAAGDTEATEDAVAGRAAILWPPHSSRSALIMSDRVRHNNLYN